MEERVNMPPTLPRSNPTVSGWQNPPDAIADLRTTVELPGTADVVIVGSGISGASIAFNLLEKDPNLKVVMLEARQACSGATGRNGGHTKAASYRSFYDNYHSIGPNEAVRIARLEYNNILAEHTFAREHGIECELFGGDTVDIVYDQRQWDEAVRSIKLMKETMPEDLHGAAKYTFHDAEDVQTKFHCQGDRAIGAISYRAGSLSAYKFVMGMLKLCLEKGLNLQANTPVASLHTEKQSEWQVHTSRGIVKAQRVVLATNGYTGYLVEDFRHCLVPLRGQITAHRPGSNMPKDGLQTTYSFIYANGYEYMISRPQGSEFAGDIIIGGGLVKAPDEGLYEYGNTDDTTLNRHIHSYLVETTPRYFGKAWGREHPDGRIRGEWTGIMGYSSDGFPFVDELPNMDRVYISASFQGHGMVLCFLCAKALVQIMYGEENELKDWFPKSFRITEKRLQKKFVGRLHTKPHDLELKAPLLKS